MTIGRYEFIGPGFSATASVADTTWTPGVEERLEGLLRDNRCRVHDFDSSSPAGRLRVNMPAKLSLVFCERLPHHTGFIYFRDPDGNTWSVQQIVPRE
jgi:hypothetical protein